MITLIIPSLVGRRALKSMYTGIKTFCKISTIKTCTFHKNYAATFIHQIEMLHNMHWIHLKCS